MIFESIQSGPACQLQAYGHRERIFDLAFCPTDSGLVASASEDCTVRLWRQEERGSACKQVRCAHMHVHAESFCMGSGKVVQGCVLHAS